MCYLGLYYSNILDLEETAPVILQYMSYLLKIYTLSDKLVLYLGLSMVNSSP